MSRQGGAVEAANAQAHAAAAVAANAGASERLEAQGRFTVQCIRDGEVIWEEEFPNLVVTAGKNNILDNQFAGSAYTATWYMGLVDGGSTPTYAAGDTMGSHAGWTENTSYSNSVRPTIAWNAASGGSKASTATSFSINATATIAGAFLTTNSTKAGTTGTLYSAGSFTSGNRAVQSGDTLSVTWTGSV